MPDGPENDYFATQFANSIVKESGAANQWWFGRMIRFLDRNQWVFKNFFGTDYTESEFRKKYEAGDITVDTFDISNVNYTIDPNDPTLATVTMNVHIVGTVDGVGKNDNFTLTHKVKQGWAAYESTLS
ncbi:MAG: hypothetical protein ACR2HG_16065 [Pyrinomonadaceae bacterium]